VDAEAPITNGAEADGEVVLIPQRWCQVSRVMIREVTGAKKPGPRGDYV
jgi:hypothetical protein